LTERTHGADAADFSGGQVLQQIGYHLRLAREERGERLEDIAQVLRIRRVYLQCLERGDLAEIPGRAYALGFLRSYGEPLPENPSLQIREPLPDSHRPPLLLVGVSIALAAVIYVGWNYWQNRQDPPRSAVETVDERPASAAAVAPRPARDAAATAAEPTPDAPADAAELTAAPSLDEQMPPLPSIPEPPMPGRADALTAAEPAADALPGEAEGEDVVTAILDGEPAASDEADAAPVGEDVAEAGSAAMEPQDLLAVIAAEGGGEDVRTFGSTEAAARIVLVAQASTWVQVRSTAGDDYVWTRTLEPGDAFFVPNRDDLALWTGNAGGLKVVVDGEPLPSLGDEGEVRRDIPLAAEALSAQYAAN
jgi:cytoskeleton protein RodZ